MSFSLTRALVFLMIGLPIGFILSALGFVVADKPIVASTLAPWAIGLAALIGLSAGLWKPAQ